MVLAQADGMKANTVDVSDSLVKLAANMRGSPKLRVKARELLRVNFVMKVRTHR